MSTYPVAHCQHIKKNGSQCGSPALRNQQFCYFHDRCRPLIQNASGSAQFPPAPLFLPLLEEDEVHALSVAREEGEVDAAGARRGPEGAAMAAARQKGGVLDDAVDGCRLQFELFGREGYLADHV